jgi:hypothetical protein
MKATNCPYLRAKPLCEQMVDTVRHLKLLPLLLLTVLAALPLVSAGPAFGESEGGRPYVIRGQAAQVKQREFTQRIERFHGSLASVLQSVAPDLIARLAPPPRPTAGYQILPRLLADTPLAPPAEPRLVTYSWGWSESLIAKETAALEKLETKLAESGFAADRAAYEVLVNEYVALVARRGLIDADFDYNWLWQKSIDGDRALYDRTTHLQGLALRRQTINAAISKPTEEGLRNVARAEGLEPGQSIDLLKVALLERARSLEMEVVTGAGKVNPPPYVRVDRAGASWVVMLPIYTDITDQPYLDSLRAAIEEHWRLEDEGRHYSVRLTFDLISPRTLYCGDEATARVAKDAASACNPPADKTSIDLHAHIGRFPAGAAVLTTGASGTYITAGRALVLGPHDVSPRLLAHEVGHLLGFPDAYIRGYRDLGADGYQVTELVIDPLDIMSSGGKVLPRHFEQLVALRGTQAASEDAKENGQGDD